MNGQRKELPNRRAHDLRDFVFRGLKYSVGVGRFFTGEIAEIFISCNKPGSTADETAKDAAIVVSIALQHGASHAAAAGGHAMNMLPPPQPFTSQAANERFCRCLLPKCKKLFPARTYRGGRPKQFCCDKHRQAYARKVARDILHAGTYYRTRLIELARACLGAIDLDPASCAEANEVVRAEVFYDIKQDGLRRPWSGRIWLNPPFGRYGPGFVRKAVDEFKAGKIERALVLVKATHVATRWFNDAMQVEHLICLPRKRINFSSPNYVTSSANFPSVLIGIGIARARFEDHFGRLGKIAFVSEAAPGGSHRTHRVKYISLFLLGDETVLCQ